MSGRDHMDPFPDDMDPRLKDELWRDILVFGTCYYEETDGWEKYERVDPTDAITSFEDGEVSIRTP